MLKRKIYGRLRADSPVLRRYNIIRHLHSLVISKQVNFYDILSAALGFRIIKL